MNRRFRFARTVTLASLATIAACRSKDSTDGAASSDSAANAAAGSLEGPTRKDTAGAMAGMPDMSGGQMGNMMGAATMDSMQTHLTTIDSVSADRMKAMLPMHRQMVANMLSRMNSEMRQMNMSADAGWTATIDSVRQDLINMPEMSGSQLKTVMPAHGARVLRLLNEHRAMMGKTKS
jgi:hypothetical protein